MNTTGIMSISGTAKMKKPAAVIDTKDSTGATVASAGSGQFSRRFSGPQNPKDGPGQKPFAKTPNVEVLPPATLDAAGLAELAAKIKVEYERGAAAFHRGFEHFLRVGELLLQAKVVAGHGKWTDWLLNNCSISETAARGYMRMAEEYPRLDAEKRQRVAVLPWREALKAISKPREAEPTTTPPTTSSSATASSERRMKALTKAWHDAEPPERAKFQAEVATLEAARPHAVVAAEPEYAEGDNQTVLPLEIADDGHDEQVETEIIEKKKAAKNRKSKRARWGDAVALAIAALEELQQIQGEYATWLERLPDNLRDSALAEKLEAVADVDLQSAIDVVTEAQWTDLP
jgi:hypothetical protein